MTSKKGALTLGCAAGLAVAGDPKKQGEDHNGDQSHSHVEGDLPGQWAASRLPVMQLGTRGYANLVEVLEVPGEFAGARIAISIALHGTVDDSCNWVRFPVNSCGGTGLFSSRSFITRKVGSSERHLPREHLVEHHTN